MYEADDVSALVSPEYLARLNAPTPATTRTLPYFRNTARAVCRRVHSVGSSTGGFMLALRANVAPRDEEAMRRQVREHAFVQAMAMTSVLACHLYAADERASNVDTAESRARAFDVPAWIVLIEASTAESAQRAREIIQSAALHRVGVRVRDAAVYALEICRLAAPAG